jgi:ribosome biogenesis GTPase / thiamine phosphate phosphatase
VSRLAALGWSPFFWGQVDLARDAGLEPARVMADLGVRLRLGLEVSGAPGALDPELGDDRLAMLPLSLRGQAVVGDWVLCERQPGREVVLRRVLERRSTLARQAAGDSTERQLMAANVDKVLVVQGLDGDANARRLERTLSAVRASGAAPVLLLTKADLHPDPAEARREAEALAPGVPVVCLAAKRGEGLDAVRALLTPGETAVLIGSSGVGKSTLLNALLGAEVAATGPMAGTGRGRHVTSHRQLFQLPGGGLLIDGPGIRELQLWEADGVKPTFDDVAELAAGCRFSDCRHEAEPHCAVLAAVEDGRLAAERLASFHKLADEVRALEARHAEAARLEAHRQARRAQRIQQDPSRKRGR